MHVGNNLPTFCVALLGGSAGAGMTQLVHVVRVYRIVEVCVVELWGEHHRAY